MAKSKFTNISTGQRGLHTVDGLVMVDPGQTVEVELAKGEDAAEEWFAKPGTKAAREAESGAETDEA